MNKETEIKLSQKALRLKVLDRDIVKSYLQNRSEDLKTLIDEYVYTKKWIKSISIDASVIKIDNPAAKEILQKISQDEELPCDNFIRQLEKSIEHSSGKEVNLTSFSEEELEDLEDEFMSWFSSRTYIENLCEIGSITLGVSLPKNLDIYVAEARSCYAFEQFNAVYALCRTILETCIRDIYLKGQQNRRNIVLLNSRKVYEMIQEVSRGTLKDRIRELYDKLSNIIHGHNTIGKKEAKESFRDTIKVIHNLYSSNRL